MARLQVNDSGRETRITGKMTCGIGNMTAAERLAAGFSHKVNNYLTGIISLTELSLMKLRPEDQIYAHLEKSLKLAWKAVDLADNVAIFAGRHKGQSKPVNINNLILCSISGLSGALPENIVIDTRLDPDARKVLTIAPLMEIVIRNVAINAAEAMSGGGTVTIATRCVRARPASVELSVSDTGVGMTEEVASRMFEPFFTTKEAGAGVGLGLSIVHGIVKKCAAAISVKSAAGNGTTVTISIPAARGWPAAQGLPATQGL